MEQMDKLLATIAQPPAEVRAGKYPDKSGRLPVHVLGEPGQETRNRGGLVGWVYPSKSGVGVFLKIIQPKHLLRVPLAICYDEATLEAWRGQVAALAVYVQTDAVNPTPFWYTVGLDDFFANAFTIAGRGNSGKQLGLTLNKWNCWKPGQNISGTSTENTVAGDGDRRTTEKEIQ